MDLRLEVVPVTGVDKAKHVYEKEITERLPGRV